MKTFFDNGVIQVTDSYLNYSGKTIHISNITTTQVAYKYEKTMNFLVLIKRATFATLFLGFCYSMISLYTILTIQKPHQEYALSYFAIATYIGFIFLCFKKKAFLKSIKNKERHFCLRVNSTLGLIEAFKTKDEEMAYQINSAIMNAMSEKRSA